MGGGASSDKKKLDLEMNPETVDIIAKLQLSDEDVKKFWYCNLSQYYQHPFIS